MPTQYPYRETIRNTDLGVGKVIRATSAEELDWLIKRQFSIRREQETRKKQRQQKEKGNRSADFVIWRSCQPLRFLEYGHGSILLSWMSAA